MKYSSVHMHANTDIQDLDAQAAAAANQFANEDPEKPNAHRELFRTILSSPAINDQEKKPERIAQEAFAVMVAGNDAIMWTFATGTYYILANKEKIMPRLREELLKVMPNPHDRPSVAELEALPWFVSLRPSHDARLRTLLRASSRPSLRNCSVSQHPSFRGCPLLLPMRHSSVVTGQFQQGLVAPQLVYPVYE